MSKSSKYSTKVQFFLRRKLKIKCEYYKSKKSFVTLASYKKYAKTTFIGISDGIAYNLTSKANVKAFVSVCYFQYVFYLIYLRVSMNRHILIVEVNSFYLTICHYVY